MHTHHTFNSPRVFLPCSNSAWYFMRASQSAVRNAKDLFVVYLKDGRPTFTIATKECVNSEKFIISKPDLLVSAAQKDSMNRHNHKEVLKVKARKEQAILARENWIEMNLNTCRKTPRKIHTHSRTLRAYFKR